MTGHAVDLYDPDVITSGMGSFFNVPAVRFSDNAQVEALIAGMRARYPGFRVVATTAHKKTPIYEEPLSGPCLVMIGNETEGLCKSFMSFLTRWCRSPWPLPPPPLRLTFHARQR